MKAGRPESLVLLLGLCFVMPALFCWSPYLDQVRDWQIPVTIVCVALAAQNLSSLDSLLGHGGRKLPVALLILPLTVGLLCSCLFHYWSFSLNAIDFSIFDTALHNTGDGRTMFSSIYSDYVLATHSFFLLFPLALLHGVFPSPYLLIVTHAIVIAGSGLCLFLLARKYLNSDLFALIVVWSFISSPWVGRIANYGFHPEVFYLLFGFLFALGWKSKNYRLWILSYVGYLCIKEDAALYMLMLGLGVILLCREHRRAGIAIFFVSLAFFVLNTAFMMPHYRSLNALPMPVSMRFWAEDGGSSISDAVTYLIQRPWATIAHIFSSKWLSLLGPLLLLPLYSRPTVFPTLGIIALLGSSSSDLMREYAVYYSAPLLPFVFWGVLEGATNILRLLPVKGQVLWVRSLCAILLVSPLFSSGSIRYPMPDFQGVSDVNYAGNLLLSDPSAHVLVQGSILPHIPYTVKCAVLSRQSLDLNADYLLANPEWDPYPEDRQWIATVIESREHWLDAQMHRSGLVILRKGGR
jgi:uncharacterized membrane protein